MTADEDYFRALGALEQSIKALQIAFKRLPENRYRLAQEKRERERELRDQGFSAREAKAEIALIYQDD